MSEVNSKIEKIQKSSKRALVATNVIRTLCIVCAVIAIVSGSCIIGFRDVIDREFQVAMESGEFTQEELLDLAEAGIDQGNIAEGNVGIVFGTYVITAGVMLVAMAIVLHFVGKVFKDFCESYSPFQPGIIKNLKVTFILLVIFVLQSSIGVGVITALAAWCVIHIFEYGCELQKQSDETL